MTKEELEQIVHPSWVKILLPLFNDSRMNDLLLFMDSEIAKGYTIYPSKKNVFKAFKLCSFDDLRICFIEIVLSVANLAIGTNTSSK